MGSGASGFRVHAGDLGFFGILSGSASWVMRGFHYSGL